MTKRKKILLTLLAVLVLVQFFCPKKNEGAAYGQSDISHTVAVPSDVKLILERACNDCHSNHTVYPWYANVQPVAWWLARHVKKGKADLNFSEFSTYKLKRKKKKLEEIDEVVEENEMPPAPYTLLHAEAELSKEEREKLLNWSRISLVSLDTLKP